MKTLPLPTFLFFQPNRHKSLTIAFVEEACDLLNQTCWNIKTLSGAVVKSTDGGLI